MDIVVPGAFHQQQPGLRCALEQALAVQWRNQRILLPMHQQHRGLDAGQRFVGAQRIAQHGLRNPTVMFSGQLCHA